MNNIMKRATEKIIDGKTFLFQPLNAFSGGLLFAEFQKDVLPKILGSASNKNLSSQDFQKAIAQIGENLNVMGLFSGMSSVVDAEFLDKWSKKAIENRGIAWHNEEKGVDEVVTSIQLLEKIVEGDTFTFFEVIANYYISIFQPMVKRLANITTQAEEVHQMTP